MERATRNCPTQTTQLRRAFTLVEILIVIVILGILATIVIPQFTTASHTARENTLKDELRYLRTQTLVFKAQHNDVPPGYPGGNQGLTPTESAFVTQMTQYSDQTCGTSASASSTYKFGPYLSRMPANSINGFDTVTVVANGAAIPAADGTTGWIYKPQTQELLPNLTGNDSSGTPYTNY